ncbi:cell division protein FtsQ/DivIB [Halalkalibacter akibai]|uniref:Cell division protein DivIB n=1 Tax=Halalkalibacter akibai (strain ATCC 43226 / DSM 21942 / CIP 109018 / JCM 9157 / 1139) TaxID=1236973 RepID=W4QR93_HALA3|nr:FtsQ-type POTRA domain-containing protein [Halalkalibacter akibai]GAE33859.1 cell division protein FtsQ [Halalkalibacter akibai JCM 9157]
MSKEKVITINERIPSLKEQRKQRANRRLLFFLSFFFLLLLLMVYFQSPLSHVRNVIVEENYFVTDDEIIRLSNIDSGTSMWSIEKQEIENRLVNHREIASASVEQRFPNTIRIQIKEYARIGYLYQEDKYFPILETGLYLDELPRHVFPSDAPLLIGFEQGDELKELSAELQKVPSELIERISEIFYRPTDHDAFAIVLLMTDGIEVHTSIRDFSGNLSSYAAIVKELDTNKKGILHLRMSPYFEEFESEEEELKSESEG